MPRRRRSRTSRLLVPAVVVIVIAAAIGAVLALRHAPAAPSPALTARQRAQEAVTRTEAAQWVASEVGHSAVVSCDPQMCAALVAAGFPRAHVQTLGPASPEPPASNLVIITARLRALFGSSLETQWASEVLANFGTSPTDITVRLIAHDGAAAYQRALDGEISTSKVIGGDVVSSPRITTSPTARYELLHGLVDQRLLAALSNLASTHPIDIVDFGNYGSGWSTNLPYRYADLAVSVPTVHMSQSAYIASMLSVLKTTLTGPYLPLPPLTRMYHGELVLRVVYSAPSPLNLLGGS